MSQSPTMHLAADLSFLHTDYLWRMPGSWVGYDYYSTSDFYEEIARIAQRGCMDMLFFGDTGGTPEDFGGSHEAPVRFGAKWPRHDMAPMIPLMAKAAPNVGFAITMSTTYHHPFYIARFFNALDHVTRGRIAWNVVTSAYKNEAANYGFEEMMDHDQRYVRADEFVEITFKLWNSVEKDAFVLDRDNGVFADPSKVHRTVPTMQQHRASLDQKLLTFGRKPRDVGILWSIRIQVAESDAAAKEKERRYLEAIPSQAGLIEMSAQYNVDFSKARPGMKLVDFADEVRNHKGNYGSFDELLKTTDTSQTVEEFGRRFLVDRVLVAAGTPKSIADKLEEMHVATGSNGGFILARGYSAMDNIREFVEHVVPELQRRGLARKEYAGRTLRENLD